MRNIEKEKNAYVLLYRLFMCCALATAVLSPLFDTFADYPILRIYSFFLSRNKSIPYNAHSAILFFFFSLQLKDFLVCIIFARMLWCRMQKKNVTMRDQVKETARKTTSHSWGRIAIYKVTDTLISTISTILIHHCHRLCLTHTLNIFFSCFLLSFDHQCNEAWIQVFFRSEKKVS